VVQNIKLRKKQIPMSSIGSNNSNSLYRMRHDLADPINKQNWDQLLRRLHEGASGAYSEGLC
jgi:hypothetical protein